MLFIYLAMIETEKDREKAEDIYYRYRGFIMAVAMEYVKSIEIAEDVTHNVMLRIINNLDKIEEVGSDKTKSFIYIIAKNVAISELKKLKKTVSVESSFFENMNGKDTEVFETVYLKTLVQKIAKLPEDLRETFELAVFHGLNSSQISKILFISETAVRKRIERARKLLK